MVRVDKSHNERPRGSILISRSLLEGPVGSFQLKEKSNGISNSSLKNVSVHCTPFPDSELSVTMEIQKQLLLVQFSYS